MSFICHWQTCIPHRFAVAQFFVLGSVLDTVRSDWKSERLYSYHSCAYKGLTFQQVAFMSLLCVFLHSCLPQWSFYFCFVQTR